MGQLLRTVSRNNCLRGTDSFLVTYPSASRKSSQTSLRGETDEFPKIHLAGGDCICLTCDFRNHHPFPDDAFCDLSRRVDAASAAARPRARRVDAASAAAHPRARWVDAASAAAHPRARWVDAASAAAHPRARWVDAASAAARARARRVDAASAAARARARRVDAASAAA